MKKTLTILVSLAILAVLLVGCGTKNEETQESSQAATTSAQTTKAVEPKDVTLKFFHWIAADAQAIVDELNADFIKVNPSIKVQFEGPSGDQYTSVLKTRLVSGDAPDVMGIYPGTLVKDWARAGYLMDLSNEPYISAISEGALKMTRGEDSKIYSIPTDFNVNVVTYNKKIFADLGLTVPSNWDEFLDVCKKIKQAKIYPIAVGNKDLWVTQVIPYAMVPSMIYSKNPNFDQDMYDGKTKFNGPEWTAVMERYKDLNDKGYFNPAILGTNYDQQIQLMATEKAAMVVMGNWILAPIRKANPNLDLGMFPLPAVNAGEDIWVSASVGCTMGISSTTKYPEEAKKYVAFWMDPSNMKRYLMAKKAFPTIKGIEVDFDPAAKDMTPYMDKGLTYPFLDANWPSGVQDVFLKGYQEMFSGKSIKEVLDSVDKEWAERTKK